MTSEEDIEKEIKLLELENEQTLLRSFTRLSLSVIAGLTGYIVIGELSGFFYLVAAIIAWLTYRFIEGSNEEIKEIKNELRQLSEE